LDPNLPHGSSPRNGDNPLFSLAQIHHLDFGAGIAHALDKAIEQQFGFALSPTPGAGIKYKYSRVVLL
jgi:hypothetical protein